MSLAAGTREDGHRCALGREECGVKVIRLDRHIYRQSISFSSGRVALRSRATPTDAVLVTTAPLAVALLTMIRT